MSGETNYTNAFWTETSEGPIHHKHWRGLSCPVKLDTVATENAAGEPGLRVAIGGNGWARPKRDDTGELVFAIPGGGNL